MNFKERKFYKENLTGVLHATLNPYEPGVVRIHLIPAKYQPLLSNQSLVILNGKDILPINLSWTILLASFIKQVNGYDGREVSEEELKEVVGKTLDEVQKVYKYPGRDILKSDLNRILSVFIDIAKGKVPNEKIGQMSIEKYYKKMNFIILYN